MAGNTFGRRFHGDELWGESRPGARLRRGRLSAGTGAQRGGSASRCRPPAAGHLAIHQPAPRARYGAHPVRRIRGQDHRHADRPSGRERRSALARLREDQGSISSRTRGLHLHQKYGFRDYRGGGRSSARETVMRVAAGAIARKYLRERLQVEIHGYLAQMGPLVLQPVDPAGRLRQSVFLPGSGAQSRSSRISSGACARRAIPSARA